LRNCATVIFVLGLVLGLVLERGVLRFVNDKGFMATLLATRGRRHRPVLRALSLCTCRRHYPGTATGRRASLVPPSRAPDPTQKSLAQQDAALPDVWRMPFFKLARLSTRKRRLLRRHR